MLVTFGPVGAGAVVGGLVTTAAVVGEAVVGAAVVVAAAVVVVASSATVVVVVDDVVVEAVSVDEFVEEPQPETTNAPASSDEMRNLRSGVMPAHYAS